MSDPKATEAVLKAIEKILELDIDYSNLDEKIEESQEVLKNFRIYRRNRVKTANSRVRTLDISVKRA